MGKKSNELLKDYKMLDKMSRDLEKHKKSIMLVGKRVAKRSKTDLTYGIADSISDIMDHIEKAQKELERAKRDIKLI